jgi:N-acetylglutamate synthase-like GNAT family acetyltransferase
VFVLPQHRRKGIGTTLCAVVEHQAAVLGVAMLYLFTLDQQSWYRKMGWRMLEPCTCAVFPVTSCARCPMPSNMRIETDLRRGLHRRLHRSCASLRL